MDSATVILDNHTQEPLNLSKAVNGEKGYSINLKLTESEIELLRTMTRIQWLYRLQLLVPKHVHQFDEAGIEYYHHFAHLIDHSSAWPKYARVFPREAVSIIGNMKFMKELEAEFGEFKIADEEGLGWGNIYWRLVRPGSSDFGSIHTERWFVELGYYGDEIKDPSLERVKIWISLYTMPGKNGLLVIPSSHHKLDWKWHDEEHYGKKKPIIDEDLTKFNRVLLPTEPGRAVVFHYDLLHGGAPNLADMTRVSMEFTFLVRK